MVVPKVDIHKNQKKKSCPWMSLELLHLIHKQKSAHRRVIKTKRRDVDLITHHRKLRNQVNNMYRRLKNEYFQLRLQYRKSPRHLWSAINHITGRHRQHHPSTAKLSDLIAHFRSLLFQPDQTNVLPSGPDRSMHFLLRLLSSIVFPI